MEHILSNYAILLLFLLGSPHLLYPLVFLFLLSLFTLLKSMAAHRTFCRKMMKCGTQIEDSLTIDQSNFGVSNTISLAPPTVQNCIYIYATNFCLVQVSYVA